MDPIQPFVDVLGANREFVRALAVALLRNEHDAEDVVQDTWLSAQGRSLPPVEVLRAWLATIARHLVFNRRRSEIRRRQRESIASRDEVQPSTLAIVEREAVRQQVLQAVLELPEPHRGIVLLRYYENRTSTDIARLRGRAASTIRVQLREGLVMLRAKLERSGGAVGADWRRVLVLWAIPRFGRVALRSLPASLLLATGRRVAVVALVLLVGVGIALFVNRPHLPPPSVPVVPILAGDLTGRDQEQDDASRVGVSTDLGRSAIATIATPMDLHGIVLDPTDHPVSGASIEVWSESGRIPGAGSPPSLLSSLRTDAEGVFRVDARRGALHRLVVTAQGYATHTEPGCFAGPQRVIHLSMPAAVYGRLTIGGEDGPCADAGVKVYQADTRQQWNARSDAQGFYRIDGIEPGRFEVAVTAPGKAPPLRRLELGAGSAHRLDIELTPCSDVVGRVVDAATGYPIAGAALAMRGEAKARARTDEDGRYRVAGLPDHLGLQLAARAPQHAESLASLAAPMQVDGSRQLDFALEPSASVQVRVIDDHGATLEGVQLALIASWESTMGIVLSACTAISDATGNGVIEGAKAGRPFALVARCDGFATAVRELPAVLVAGKRTVMPDLVLQAESTLEGIVEDESGRPLEGLRISLTGCDLERDDWREGQEVLRSGEPYVSDCGDLRTDSSGRFAFGGLAAGSYRIIASRTGGLHAEQPVEVARGVTATGVVVRVELGMSIAGEVQTVAGERTERAYVRITPLDGQPDVKALLAPPDGRLVIRQLRRGRYRVDVHPIDAGIGLPAGFDCEAGARGLVFRLAPSVTITGRIVTTQGEPRAARVYARTCDSLAVVTSGASAGADGGFAIEVPVDRPVDLGVAAPESLFGLPLRVRNAGALAGLIGPRRDLQIIVE